MLARVANQSGADFATMARLEKEREITFPFISMDNLNDLQKEALQNATRQRCLARHCICNELQA